MEANMTQNLNSFMKEEDGNTHRQLRMEKEQTSIRKQKELTGFDRLAIEMDKAIENLKQNWTNEDLQEQRREMLMSSHSTFRKSQQHFGNYHSGSSRKDGQFQKEFRNKHINHFTERGGTDMGPDFLGEEPLATDQDMMSMKALEEQNRLDFIKELQELNENEIAMKIEKELMLERRAESKKREEESKLNTLTSHKSVDPLAKPVQNAKKGKKKKQKK